MQSAGCELCLRSTRFRHQHKHYELSSVQQAKSAEMTKVGQAESKVKNGWKLREPRTEKSNTK
uniref:Uncharacterized protein n=1 Tax=Anguilla anguilla TaxID=7936 RepID=A0A0E9SGK7_ANGAN